MATWIDARMWDKLDLEIPFDPLHVRDLVSDSGSRAGWVDLALYDFKGIALVTFEDGKPVYETSKAVKWDSIPSSISSVAVGFFPEGNGFNRWPHVRVKASPAKILQGHNVFGSEDITQGAVQIISTLKLAFPKISAHLDFNQATVKYVDCTYSARIPSAFFRSRLFKLVESTASSRTKVNSRHEGYLQLGVGSEFNRQKMYEKYHEVMSEIADAKKKNQVHRYRILKDKRLLDWALDLLRFEATIGHRQLERLGIPTRFFEFVKFHDWFNRVYQQTLCKYLFDQNFSKVFSDLEGHTMKNVDDENIKLMIDSKLIKIGKNGKPNRRIANSVWNTYRAIKLDGYSALSSPDSSSFYRHVSLLVNEVGLSKAFLKSLSPEHKDNVVPIISVIDLDFSNQRPDWWVEPKAGYEDAARHLRLVS